jgi:hypothetical protein
MIADTIYTRLQIKLKSSRPVILNFKENFHFLILRFSVLISKLNLSFPIINF